MDVTVTDFSLDTFPVTVGRFRKFVDGYTGAPIAEGAGMDLAANLPPAAHSGWRSGYNQYLLPNADALRASLKCDQQMQPGAALWTDAPGPNENKPINCVDWFHAFAFCIWDGGWLPIEATWEYAAAGGLEDRLYPWGQTLPNSSLVPFPCTGSKGACDGATLPDVGSFPMGIGKWGHLDLTGYLWQWMQDAQHFYDKNPMLADNCLVAPECFVPLAAGGIPEAMIRGGGSLTAAATSADRGWLPGQYPSAETGIRCARK